MHEYLDRPKACSLLHFLENLSRVFVSFDSLYASFHARAHLCVSTTDEIETARRNTKNSGDDR